MPHTRLPHEEGHIGNVHPDLDQPPPAAAAGIAVAAAAAAAAAAAV
jgi:hypothetical protein